MKLSRQTVKDYAIITLAIGIIAVAVYFFMMPSNLSIGSATALALVIHNFVDLPVSVITFIINAVLLVLGFLLIGPEFGAKTIYGTTLLPIFLRIFEVLLPNQQSLTQDALLDTVCYIIVVSAGLALLFGANGSSGGLDIVAKLMNKYLRMDMGQAMSVAGILVAVSGALCYESKTVALSVLGTYFNGMVVDRFIFGMNIKRKVCILSTSFDTILEFILHHLHSGASIYELTGAYDRQVRKEIVTIVDKQEYKALMDYVRKTDPKAFVTVYSVNEINYTPKK